MVALTTRTKRVVGSRLKFGDEVRFHVQRQSFGSLSEFEVKLEAPHQPNEPRKAITAAYALLPQAIRYLILFSVCITSNLSIPSPTLSNSDSWPLNVHDRLVQTPLNQ